MNFFKKIFLIFLLFFILEGILRLLNLPANRIVRQTDYFLYITTYIYTYKETEKAIKKIKPFKEHNKKYRLKNPMPPYNYFTANYNNFGFRGNNFLKDKSKNTLRIFLMGDSTVFGWGIADEETISANLPKLLEKNIPNRNVEIINAGFPGASLSDGLNFLENFILKYHPDIIIANYFENDISFHGALLSKKKVGKISIKLIYYLGYSEIFLTLRSFLNYILIKTGLSGSKKLLYTNTFYGPKNYEKKLEKFYNICSKNNVYLVYITIPICLKLDHIFYSSLRDLREYYKNIILKTSKKNSFLYIDLEEDFENYPLKKEDVIKFGKESNWTKYFPFTQTPFLIEEYYPLFIDVSHPNDLGNKLIDKRLYYEMQKFGYLK